MFPNTYNKPLCFEKEDETSHPSIWCCDWCCHTDCCLLQVAAQWNRQHSNNHILRDWALREWRMFSSPCSTFYLFYIVLMHLSQTYKLWQHCRIFSLYVQLFAQLWRVYCSKTWSVKMIIPENYSLQTANWIFSSKDSNNILKQKVPAD